jgi:hypothetical protein
VPPERVREKVSPLAGVIVQIVTRFYKTVLQSNVILQRGRYSCEGCPQRDLHPNTQKAINRRLPEIDLQGLMVERYELRSAFSPPT